MKYLLSFLFLTSFVFLSGAQGTIVGFTMSPANPTSTDTIYIDADVQFTSGDCTLDSKSHSVTGLNIQATAHHCLGVALYICDVVDTYKINPLPDGNYSFNLSLNSGSGPSPCSPGIVVDDDSTFNFTVGEPGGFSNSPVSQLSIYPNPVQNHINLPSISDGTAYKIITVSGQVVKSGLIESRMINNLEVLPSGIYFLKIETPSGVRVGQIAKE